MAHASHDCDCCLVGVGMISREYCMRAYLVFFSNKDYDSYDYFVCTLIQLRKPVIWHMYKYVT